MLISVNSIQKKWLSLWIKLLLPTKKGLKRERRSYKRLLKQNWCSSTLKECLVQACSKSSPAPTSCSTKLASTLSLCLTQPKIKLNSYRILVLAWLRKVIPLNAWCKWSKVRKWMRKLTKLLRKSSTTGASQRSSSMTRCLRRFPPKCSEMVASAISCHALCSSSWKLGHSSPKWSQPSFTVGPESVKCSNSSARRCLSLISLVTKKTPLI